MYGVVISLDEKVVVPGEQGVDGVQQRVFISARISGDGDVGQVTREEPAVGGRDVQSASNTSLDSLVE